MSIQPTDHSRKRLGLLASSSSLFRLSDERERPAYGMKSGKASLVRQLASDAREMTQLILGRHHDRGWTARQVRPGQRQHDRYGKRHGQSVRFAGTARG